MADTMQIVRWTLERECSLRAGEAIKSASESLASLRTATLYAKLSSRPEYGWGVFGDVCVTSVRSASVPKRLRGQDVRFPSDGFLLSRVFSPIGGVRGLEAMCRACPANASAQSPAGCAGVLYQYPRSKETQEQLEGIVSRLGLASALEEHYVRTNPMWYGLWARSPVAPEALPVLAKLISEMHREDAAASQDERHLGQLGEFVRATEVAIRTGILLHVSLAPPGHADLGFHTVFPHCPLCKAEARVARWQRAYPSQLYSCDACGTEYSPAEMGSMERDQPEESSLEDQLSRDEFAAFAKSYLQARGLSEADALEVYELTTAEGEDRDWRNALERARGRLCEEYQREILFAGIPRVAEAASSESESEGEPIAKFRPKEFEVLLRRCLDYRIRVVAMFHHSEQEELDRSTLDECREPLLTFASWSAEGCHEQFSAILRIPEETLRSHFGSKYIEPQWPRRS